MKENQMVQPVLDMANRTVTFKIADGGPDLVLKLAQCHPDVVAQAALVGMGQVRIVDAAAIGAADKDGRIRSRAERMALKREKMAVLIDHYNAGNAQWSPTRTGTSGPDTGIILRALARVKGWDVARAETEVAAMCERRGKDRPTVLRKLAGAPLMVKAIADIRAENAPDGADDLLAELGEDAGE